MAVRPEYTTSTFWLNTGERVIRTAAQTALALLITDKTTAADIDWQQGGLTVGLAALTALLMALAGKGIGDPGTPSYLLPAPREDRPADHVAMMPGGPVVEPAPPRSEKTTTWSPPEPRDQL